MIMKNILFYNSQKNSKVFKYCQLFPRCTMTDNLNAQYCKSEWILFQILPPNHLKLKVKIRTFCVMRYRTTANNNSI